MAIFAQDITNRESFDNLAKWLGEVDRYCHGGDVAKIVVGCKCVRFYSSPSNALFLLHI
jgi:hypothetical protein